MDRYLLGMFVQAAINIWVYCLSHDHHVDWSTSTFDVLMSLGNGSIYYTAQRTAYNATHSNHFRIK